MTIDYLMSKLKSKRLLSTLSGLIFLIAMGLAWRDVAHIKTTEQQVFLSRAESIDAYMQSYRGVTKALAETFKTIYAREKNQPLTHPALTKLKNYPEFNVFGISGFVEDQGYESLVGSLTGSGDSKTLDESIRREISAAIGLDPQIALQIEGSSELVWGYYTSAKNFIYIAPKQPVAVFHYDKSLYEQVFWTRALPAVNPSLQAIITPLYEDTAGKGLMTTISTPVVMDGRLFGVVSVDIGLRTLRAFNEAGYVLGQSTLVAADGSVIARSGDMKVGERFDVPLNMTQGGYQFIAGDWWLTRPIADGQLVLAHHLPISAVVTEALIDTAHIWLIFAVIIGLAIIL